MTKNLIKKKPLNKDILVKLDKNEIEEIISKYPSNRKSSAVLPLLHLVQKKAGGWLPVHEMERVANILEMSYMRVFEIASFYTMFNIQPVGKYLLQVCKTTPCWLRGADDIQKCIKDNLDLDNGKTSKDGIFTLMEVECLGACVNAPILQINDDYYEDLDYKSTKDLLDKLKKNIKTPKGSKLGRKSSEPLGFKGN
ncbi:MAG: NADH-quinone oxidoreductase subunit NuoE [SAR116 cluster bacterium]|nr:NADH-quinone oxidoreductase subunit NuoE [SAR116 cluster bacterium]